MDEACWFEAMQEEIHEFDLLEVWELVPKLDCEMVISLKWIYKVKLDEYGDVLKNKAWPDLVFVVYVCARYQAKPTKKHLEKKTASGADKPKKPTPVKKPVLAKQAKHVKEKSTKPNPLKKTGKGRVKKVRKGKSSLQLVDKEEQVHPKPEP
nr:integrase, catalytic region, zinc finger, CCHC-type, peptidase aspartic, catalytic [Tanacetum cinerariifolium]